MALCAAASLVLLVLLGPLLISPRPLDGGVPPRELADTDSQFVDIDGLDVHVKIAGSGEPTLLLLHGFGASLYSWQAVSAGLGELGSAIAYDRPAFGLTERPLRWEGTNPYGAEAQVALATGLLDRLGAKQAILIGHSAGGAVAMQVALAHPERVRALILVAPAVYRGGGSPAWLRPLLATPQMRRLGPLLVRRINARSDALIRDVWHDPTLLTEETIALYRKPLRVADWDRALWEFTLASRPSPLVERLDALRLPVLVVSGDDDHIVPVGDSIRLASALPNAQLAVIRASGHVPHEERPDEFLRVAHAFIQGLAP